jgi:hypothetical protein
VSPFYVVFKLKRARLPLSGLLPFELYLDGRSVEHLWIIVNGTKGPIFKWVAAIIVLFRATRTKRTIFNMAANCVELEVHAPSGSIITVMADHKCVQWVPGSIYGQIDLSQTSNMNPTPNRSAGAP